MRELPKDYSERMRELLGEEYHAYLDNFDGERLFGLRVNTGKISPSEFAGRSPFSLAPVPWASNGFYYQGESRPSRDPYYFAGLYYLQEPSAMGPASLLPVCEGDRVLDLCAAPGGKSTELGARLSGSGLLVANDLSNSRAKALLKNLELWGIPNICVTSEESGTLAREFCGFFDKILVDAPCSGEGMFRKDPDMQKAYRERGPEYYAPIQKEIAAHAAAMLRPGGMLLYSTCTFSVCENEEVVNSLLEGPWGLKMEKLPSFPGAARGIGLPGALRFYPHRVRGEGHFMALLSKAGEPEDRDKAKTPFPGRAVRLSSETKDFLNRIGKHLDPRRIACRDNLVYYLPEGFLPGRKLRYLRTGLLLGEQKKNRFEPSQALAMALKPQEFDTVISWPRVEERVIRYLKGETVPLKPGEEKVEGWCLVCVEEFPLGFAKGAGTMLKNKYCPGWRWQ